MNRMLLAALGLFCAAGLAQAAPPPRGGQKPAVTQVDPAGVEAFRRMGAYVAALPSFAISTRYSFDVVAQNGQTVTVDGTGEYQARRPDKLTVTIDNELFGRKYIYDGKTLTVVSPDDKYYAQLAALPTIRAMLRAAASELSVEIPLADLFDLGTPDDPAARLTSAFLVGEAQVDGATAQHWAFRSGTRDWELWIAAGDRPLPLKFALADRAQPERPRYSVTLRWTERPDLPDAAFAFTPAADNKPVEFMSVGQRQGAK